ncbi:GlnD [Desulforapulum autotrophicum HRM2]|uniref:Bifunctional uridylyltransferase/uridylyl-removing enzyme n=1 Tax=Desulforapulum autotrophicum (strain ATCC 43914 / DSM 3382 / VKM B-1955 / HRM2) TaxID=177437 RepID=C0QJ08_DESAH|nr:[protein-PII] uridylyltransferase [Desulforapulum autotrophicum]ACN13798.1 GlnD [Desulforapulum autotrophicum HRM2]
MDKLDSQQLIERRNVLVERFLKKRQPEFLVAFTQILDEYFQTVFTKSDAARTMLTNGNPVALIALGGYGRQEQCIHSDVDLLVLFEKKIPPNADDLIKELVYPLWDARLETGYAVRTIKECLSMAWEQFDVMTTFLDARFICGASHVYLLLMERFKKELNRRHLATSLTRLVKNGEKRHTDFGDSTYLLEPNLKSGHGGLRDYHTLLWYGRIKADIKTRKELEHHGFLSHDEFETLEEALNFIWQVRNMLHYLTGRKCDQLHFDHQVEVAKQLGYHDKKGLAGVEIFLGDLHTRTDFIKQITQVVTEDILFTRSPRFGKPRIKPTKHPGIIIRQRRLYFSSVEEIPSHLELLLKIFVESGRLKIPISLESRRIVADFAPLIDKGFRESPANARDFEKILASSLWEFNVLFVMLATGLLERYIPEMSAIANKIQYNQYHLFPVDKHSIRCVQVINGFKRRKKDSEADLYSAVFNEVRNRRILLLAALFHDIGKGDPASEHSTKGAQITAVILKRLGYNPGEIQEAVFLVQNHLFLVKTATRRDISDEETAVFCASKIETVSRLRKLYLLSVADSMATGSKAWNDWTENLLRDLFLKTLNILKKGELASKKATRVIEAKKAEVLALKRDGWSESSLLRELDSMANRYLLHMAPDVIVEHLELFKKLGNKNFTWKISREANSDVRTVAICGRDKPGFYSKLAGVFFLNNLNILGSQAFSWGGEIVLDIFKVTPPADRIFEAEKWETAEQQLYKALDDDTFLQRLRSKIPKTLTPPKGNILRPNLVKIDNATSSFFTIIEVFTYDFPGLLFAVTNALYRQGLDVRMAMVATKVDQVVDVFYVRSMEDNKIQSDERAEQVKQTILKALPKITMGTE